MSDKSRAWGGLASLVIAASLALGGCSNTPALTTTSSEAPVSSTSTTTIADSPTVRIGVLLPLSGELAEQGQACLAGIELAVKHVNDEGGIGTLGGKPLEVVAVDTEGDPDNAQAGFEELVETEGVTAVIGAYQSSAALRAQKTAEELTTPFLVSVGAANEITEQELAYTFRLWPKAEWYARDQIRFLSQYEDFTTEPVTKVALLHEEGEFGTQTAADQKEYLAAAGIEVVDEITYPAGQVDFSQMLSQVKTGEAQVLLTATYLADAVLIADYAQRIRLGIPIFDAGGGMSHPDLLSLAGPQAESLITEMEYFPATSATQLEAGFEQAHGAPFSAPALYSYQAVWVIADAVKRAASADRTLVRDALTTTFMREKDHMVLPQKLLSFDTHGQNRAAQLFVVQVQDEAYVPVWPEDYAKAPVILP